MRLISVVVLATALVAAAAPAEAAGPRTFPNCAALVAYGQAHAPTAGPLVRPGVLTPQAADEGAGAKGAAPADSSTTNVQEPGVDEPDVLKSDGSTAFTVHGGRLYAADVRAQTPRFVGSLALPEGVDPQLLLTGKSLLVAAREDRFVRPLDVQRPLARPAIAIQPFGRPRTVLTLVDVSDPSAPRIRQTLTVDGAVVASRLTGDTARVVLSTPARAILQPDRRASSTAWRPSATLRLGRSRHAATRPLLPCGDIRLPPLPSGVSTLSVLTLDLAHGLDPVDVDGLMTDAETVYASPDELDVASTSYTPDGPSTQIAAFGTADATRTTYRGSGAVPGTLLDQFALSARNGILRVATTTEAPRDPQTGAPTGESQSAVTTLALRDGRLVQVGRVGGLGRGERVFAVRFLGDVAYVVTFRQTDPLYTLDLSDPARPRVAGELELEGYSAYLHPVGDGLLLGVGQDATPDGRTRGTQVSLFDVADPAHPRRLSRATLGADSSSAVEYDHHAFLWWPATNLAVVPVQGAKLSGAVGFTVTRAGGIDELGRVTQPDGNGVRRALVVGDRLVTLGDDGLQFADLRTLAPQTRLAFGPSPSPPPRPVPIPLPRPLPVPGPGPERATP